MEIFGRTVERVRVARDSYRIESFFEEFPHRTGYKMKFFWKSDSSVVPTQRIPAKKTCERTSSPSEIEFRKNRFFLETMPFQRNPEDKILPFRIRFALFILEIRNGTESRSDPVF